MLVTKAKYVIDIIPWNKIIANWATGCYRIFSGCCQVLLYQPLLGNGSILTSEFRSVTSMIFDTNLKKHRLVINLMNMHLNQTGMGLISMSHEVQIMFSVTVVLASTGNFRKEFGHIWYVQWPCPNQLIKSMYKSILNHLTFQFCSHHG